MSTCTVLRNFYFYFYFYFFIFLFSGRIWVLWSPRTPLLTSAPHTPQHSCNTLAQPRFLVSERKCKLSSFIPSGKGLAGMTREELERYLQLYNARRMNAKNAEVDDDMLHNSATSGNRGVRISVPLLVWAVAARRRDNGKIPKAVPQNWIGTLCGYITSVPSACIERKYLFTARRSEIIKYTLHAKNMNLHCRLPRSQTSPPIYPQR